MREIRMYRCFFTLLSLVMVCVWLSGTPGYAEERLPSDAGSPELFCLFCPRFPGDGASGPPLRYWLKRKGQIIRDLNTKLEWEQKTEGGDGASTCLTDLHGVDSTCTWAQATGAWIDALNAENFAGHSDWRLPNVRELMSIVDYSVYDPAIDTMFFDPTAAGAYWSSTTAAGGPLSAWGIGFDGGLVAAVDKDFSVRVRAVRGGR